MGKMKYIECPDVYKFNENHLTLYSPKYNIEYVVKNCNSQLLEVLDKSKSQSSFKSL